MGSGSAGYIPLWNTPTYITNSILFQTQSRIGIGTITPSCSLDVSGVTRTSTLYSQASTFLTLNIVTQSYLVVTDNTTDQLWKMPTSTLGVKNYYGSFYHDTTLTVASASVAYSMSFNQQYAVPSGISTSGSIKDKIKIDNTGIYNIRVSAHIHKSTTSTAAMNIWLRKNGTDIAFSNTEVVLSGSFTSTLVGSSNNEVSFAGNWQVSSTAGDYYQVMYAADSTNIAITTYTPVVGPSIPSAKIEVSRVG
jgi:hypothetical protein